MTEAMTASPEREPAEIPAADPQAAIQLLLAQAELSKAQIAVSARISQPGDSLALRDLSPLGR
jgi:hypothetical protein